MPINRLKVQSPEGENSSSVKPSDKTGPSAEERCPSCNLHGPVDRMIYCDGCKEYYHLDCVGENIRDSTNEWLCETCLIKRKSIRQTATSSQVKSSNILADQPKKGDQSLEQKEHTELVRKYNKALNAHKKVVIERDAIQAQFAALNAARNADANEIASSRIEISELKDAMQTLIMEMRAKESRAETQRSLPASHQVSTVAVQPGVTLSVQSSFDENDEVFESSPPKDGQDLIPNKDSGSVSFDPEAFTASILGKVSGMLKNLIPQPQPTSVRPLTNLPKAPSTFSDYFDRGVDNRSELSSLNVLTTSLNRKFIQSLPKFNGDYKDWAYFESVYISTTAQGNYTELENVNRLREALQHPASTMVRSLMMFSCSATDIMDELREAYGRPELLNVALMTDVMEIRQSKGSHDIEQLCSLSLAVRNYVASMEAIGRHSQLFNEFAISSLAYKLSHQLQSEWEAYKITSSESASLKTFSQFLLKKVREIPPSLKRSFSSSESSASRGNNDNKRRRVMTHQKAPQETKVGAFYTRQCFKCKVNHPLFRCEEFLQLSVKERYKFIFDNKVCSACLQSTDHRWKDCPRKRVCGLRGCEKYHNRALHNSNPAPWNNNRSEIQSDSQKTQSRNEKSVTRPSPQPQTSSASSLSHQRNVDRQSNGKSPSLSPSTHQMMSHIGENFILFKILPVRIYGENAAFVDTFAFLDDGSSLTLLDKEIHKSLNLKGSSELLHLQWTKGIVRTENSYRTSISISAVGSKKQHRLTNVYAVEHLDLPEQTVNVDALKARYPHLRNLPLPDVQGAKPKILIGLQHAKFLLGTNNHIGRDEDPIASKTQLGWTVYGNAKQSFGVVALTCHKNSAVQLSIHEATKHDEDLHKLVKGFFTTENFGVSPITRDLVSAETVRANDVMNRTLKFVDDRYEIGLLWKADNLKLPDSYPMAMNRLISLEKTLIRKPALLEWKNNHVKDLLAKGYARIASVEELKRSWPRVWYSPTFVVVNANKDPPKPRDVADVAANVRGESLNSNLLKGPDNMAPLLSGLFKFRENFIAVNADVKEMFHQVKIIEEDQQCQRFLWRNGDDSKPPTVYVMQRMMFGPTCSPACAQFVKNTHAAKFSQQCPEAAIALIRYTYVDDYFNSHTSETEAFKVLNDAFEICSSMGFDLIGVQSNCKQLLDRLPKEKVKNSLVSIDRQDADNFIAKVLGMFWQPHLDYFTYKIANDELTRKMLETDYRPTKREILRTLMRIYDPLGYLSHYLIRGKIVMQEIWREGFEWDEVITSSLIASWQEFFRQLPNIELIRIPRHYAPVVPSETRVSLIVFVDASERAFAATAYLRFEKGDQVHIALVMAKSKVAPIKQLTVPQLELQAAVLGVRLAITIKKMHSIHITETKFLSDSMVVLAWICSKKYNFKTFVASRVGEILESSNRRSWYHIGTNDNVADDATKWIDPEMGNNDTRWFKGPDFLKQPIDSWPLKPAFDCKDDEETVQFRTMIHFSHTIAKNPFKSIDEIGPRFSARWSSLVRVVAYMRRVKLQARHKIQPSVNSILPTEFLDAENVIFKRIQYEAFHEEFLMLKKLSDGSKHSLFHTSSIAKLSPFMKDDIIRMGSRSQKARISYASKNPIILPNKHPLVDALITHFHEKNFHMGEEMTIADIRERVWVIDVRTAVQRIKRNCQLCKILRAKPLMPVMGELPIQRVDFGIKPFTHVGLDAFGPYMVKFGRGSIKRYGMIFTCLTYRAVHLEVVNDMTTDLTIMAIRRFLVRRGGSAHFYSDNGSNFVGAKNLLHEDLKKIIEPLEVDVIKKLGIRWHFQPAYSPWWGGAWERLIQSIKKCINYVMLEEVPREDIFLNAMIEAEFWMNRRPLTHTPIDHDDAAPLTPNAVLFGDDQENLAASIGIFNVSDEFSRKAYRRTQHLVSKFLGRWNREYLPLINRRSKWFQKTHPIKVDDVVILTDPTQPKNAWKKGLVTRIYAGDDGIVRAADVKLSDKTIKKNRSVGRIAVLEVRSSEQTTEPLTGPEMSQSNTNSTAY